MMWSLRHFDDILNKMRELQEPTVQTSTGGSCMCNQAQQEKRTFQRLEIYKHESAQQWIKKGSVIWQFLNSHKERTAKLAPNPPPPPTSKEVVTGPRSLKTAPRTLKRLGRKSFFEKDFFFSHWHKWLRIEETVPSTLSRRRTYDLLVTCPDAQPLSYTWLVRAGF